MGLRYRNINPKGNFKIFTPPNSKRSGNVTSSNLTSGNHIEKVRMATLGYASGSYVPGLNPTISGDGNVLFSSDMNIKYNSGQASYNSYEKKVTLNRSKFIDGSWVKQTSGGFRAIGGSIGNANVPCPYSGLSVSSDGEMILSSNPSYNSMHFTTGAYHDTKSPSDQDLQRVYHREPSTSDSLPTSYKLSKDGNMYVYGSSTEGRVYIAKREDSSSEWIFDFIEGNDLPTSCTISGDGKRIIKSKPNGFIVYEYNGDTTYPLIDKLTNLYEYTDPNVNKDYYSFLLSGDGGTVIAIFSDTSNSPTSYSIEIFVWENQAYTLEHTISSTEVNENFEDDSISAGYYHSHVALSDDGKVLAVASNGGYILSLYKKIGNLWNLNKKVVHPSGLNIFSNGVVISEDASKFIGSDQYSIYVFSDGDVQNEHYYYINPSNSCDYSIVSSEKVSDVYDVVGISPNGEFLVVSDINTYGQTLTHILKRNNGYGSLYNDTTWTVELTRSARYDVSINNDGDFILTNSYYSGSESYMYDAGYVDFGSYGVFVEGENPAFTVDGSRGGGDTNSGQSPSMSRDGTIAIYKSNHYDRNYLKILRVVENETSGDWANSNSYSNSYSYSYTGDFLFLNYNGDKVLQYNSGAVIFGTLLKDENGEFTGGVSTNVLTNMQPYTDPGGNEANSNYMYLYPSPYEDTIFTMLRMYWREPDGTWHYPGSQVMSYTWDGIQWAFNSIIDIVTIHDPGNENVRMVYTYPVFHTNTDKLIISHQIELTEEYGYEDRFLLVEYIKSGNTWIKNGKEHDILSEIRKYYIEQNYTIKSDSVSIIGFNEDASEIYVKVTKAGSYNTTYIRDFFVLSLT